MVDKVWVPSDGSGFGDCAASPFVATNRSRDNRPCWFISWSVCGPSVRPEVKNIVRLYDRGPPAPLNVPCDTPSTSTWYRPTSPPVIPHAQTALPSNDTVVEAFGCVVHDTELLNIRVADWSSLL